MTSITGKYLWESDFYRSCIGKYPGTTMDIRMEAYGRICKIIGWSASRMKEEEFKEAIAFNIVLAYNRMSYGTTTNVRIAASAELYKLQECARLLGKVQEHGPRLS